MVGHVEPVTHILASAVDRYLLAEETLADDERDELLGELVGPVVVRASGPDDWRMVRVNGRLAEKVCRSLGSTVRATRVKRCALHEEAFLAERTVHLVRGDLEHHTFLLPYGIRASSAGGRPMVANGV